jgi:hypothetical protein
MITAKEAKKLYDESGAEVDHFLKHTVEINVVSAAKSGKRYATVHLGTVPQFEYLHQVITPLQHAVVDKLKELGYQAAIKLDGEQYVPRGWADDDGNGRTVQNYQIVISW